jgi:uncharacterized protein YqeY
MATLLEQINDGWKAAMKSGETQRKDTLSMLRAAVKKAEIDARSGGSWSGDDADVQAVIEREAKKRRDSIEEYQKANRQDLADIESAELAILQEFLPTQLSNEELEVIVREEIEKSGASGPAAMGALMKAVMPRVQGRADGKQVNALVRQLLG